LKGTINNNYWRFLIIYSSVVLILKFLFQTYPISDYMTRDDNSEDNSKSVNDYFKTIRLGLEVIEQGKNFVNYFLFEALVLMTVTFNMFIEIFGGVWKQEAERETIQQAALRIASIQRHKQVERKVREIEEEDKEEGDGILPSNYDQIKLKRSYSYNDLGRLREIKNELKLKTTDVSIKYHYVN
jgi:hypothetical protein